MLLKQDLNALWDAYEATKKVSSILAGIDKCRVDPKSQYIRSEIRLLLRQSRRKMVLLKQRLEQTNIEDMFK